MVRPYTEDDLDEAIAHSVSPGWWEGNGPSTPAYSRVMAMREASLHRWLRQMPEDRDSEIIRQAWADLGTLGHFKFEGED